MNLEILQTLSSKIKKNILLNAVLGGNNSEVVLLFAIKRANASNKHRLFVNVKKTFCIFKCEDTSNVISITLFLIENIEGHFQSCNGLSMCYFRSFSNV